MSRVSSIRSAARATFSAPSQIPIRWRLAGGSALLTLIILCAFAGVVGALISERIHEDFDDQVSSAARELQSNLKVQGIDLIPGTNQVRLIGFEPNLDEFAASNKAVIRVVTRGGRVVRSTERTADLGPPQPVAVETKGYRIETRLLPRDLGTGRINIDTPLFVQYGRPLDDTEATIQRVRLFLVIGVLSGAGLALLAGLMIARRAMAPIAELTATAREIERTRDPARRIASVEADDEVAELARTLDGMLRALDASRTETEAALTRQREFVADASHELRTPLTSVLANLELLADQLEGEPREAARSALRSSRRMRRLVADLLLLARADAERQAPHAPTDVGAVLVEAAAELGAIADGHELSVDADRAMVDGARDELHRLALNLMENALRHTPAGTQVRATVERTDDEVTLVVEDDGPGIPDELRDRVFERFVRGAGDRGGSFGLGLSIVRAVATSHGGRVTLRSHTEGPQRGTRFEITLPALHDVREPALSA
jgi:two-component system OmpR family sensor kinase